MAGKPAEGLRAHVEALRLDTEYVTCLVRFGRVFFGLGMLVLGLGLLKWDILPKWLALSTGLLGIAAMALTMGLPDNLEYYAPVFHLNALWFVAAGFVMKQSGLRLKAQE
jgi:peptidoglycan/LPS O-acetylase OafA/YrhL